MQAKDGSSGFDFTGTYTEIKEHKLIEYDMDDGRHVKTEFEGTPSSAEASAGKPEGVRITTTFDPESENPIETQRSGWQAILENFKKYAEKI